MAAQQSLLPEDDPQPRGDRMPNPYSQTVEGYEFDEVASAFQKSIRRGLEVEAMHWAIALEQRYPWYVWKRLRITVCEDIEDPAIMVYTDVCYRQYKELYEEAHRKGGHGRSYRMFLAAAILHACRAKKSSMNSDFSAVMYDRFEKQGWRLEIPDWALDKHTRRGRGMGRTELDFVRTGGLHANEDRELVNPYTEEYQQGVIESHGLDPNDFELHKSLSDAE